jgi:glycine cleavage system H lipoate-binding protein
MSCPFLKETEVRSCDVSPVRKMIPRTDGSPDDEKCSSPGHVECALLRGRDASAAPRTACPHLRTTLVQYCAAATVTRFIPYSEALTSCCLTEGYRYCDLYVSWAEPERALRIASGAGAVEVPPHLAFSPNHMWLDLREDGTWHMGLDGFFAKIAGEVEKVSPLETCGACLPAAAVTVGGVDVPIVFPGRLHLGGVNPGLRIDPLPITRDPYGRGWIFQGREPLASAGADRDAGLDQLLAGGAALEWMRGESERIVLYVRDRLWRPSLSGAPLVNDGGIVAGPIARHLDREDRLQLFNAFFSPRAVWRRP